MPLLNGVWLINAEGVPHQVPDYEAVIAGFVGRGWQVTDLPSDLDSDDPEFIELLESRQVEDQAETEPPEIPVEAESVEAVEPVEAEARPPRKKEDK